ncbi:mannitol dehydrogenase family protein [Thalassococcus sp. BH17M4-6]|uniref:mannitol dehydrogenase family protein n=1 Tax=Thalassococcus sp. BH17M4-6 TaxID=3413148 RepID=UPI003BEA52BD
MATKLTLANLIKLPQTVAQPFYRRADLSPGILHIGVGNFHRAHMAVYLDRLFNLGRDHDWAIVGAGVKSFDALRRDSMADQDWLTTVVELDPEGFSARVTGSMMDFCPVEQQATLERLADPAIRIVSMTITEGGYYVNAEGGFDAAHPEIKADAANPDDPKTVFGLLLAGLQRRRDAGTPPFTILSCDNLPENGHVARQTVLGLAGLISQDLYDWVAENVAFPNSMVDCITPGTSDRERQMVAEKFDIEDAQPVACEPFRQWVMEDNFPLGRPALEEVGVEFVEDVAPYETMKLRILNAGHAAIAYPGALLGHHFVHDAMADEDVAGFLTTLMRREVIPVLPRIPGVDFDAYLRMCVKRFANPEIGDTIPRLCQDGSNRQPKFVLPTIREAIAAGKGTAGLALEVALWCRYCATVEALDDPNSETLRAAANAAGDDPAAFLAQKAIFGDLAQNPTFAAAFAQNVRALWATDVRSVLKAYLQAQ